MTKVFIENLPEQTHWLVTWSPIIIALLALIISLCSLRWAILQFRASSRPYVWAMDFANLDENGLVVNQPHTVAIRVSNSPAAINSIKYEYYYLANGEKVTLYDHDDEGRVLFPDSSSQFTHTFAELEKKRSEMPDGLHLCRKVEIEYSGLSGATSHKYLNSSKPLQGGNQWELVKESSS